MKATNKEEKKDKIEKPAEEVVFDKAESLLPVKTLEGKFKNITSKISKFQEYALDVVIDTDHSLAVAENNSALINETLKNIEDVRKMIKEPYFLTVKEIDAYAKTFTEPLTKAKKSVNDAIANYKAVQAATARIAAEAARKKVEELADEKAEEADRISRIESQLIARLYGGHWFNALNQKKTSAGAINEVDCDNLMEIIKDKIPKLEEFTHLKEEYAEMKKGILKKLAKHKSNIIESNSESKVIRENALKNIDSAKEEAGIEVNTKKDEMTNDIIKEAKKEMKASESEVKEAGKGVRNILKFEVSDEISAVNKEWLMLDEIKVRAWIAENKDLIKKEFAEGRNVIHGVKFYIEPIYASR